MNEHKCNLGGFKKYFWIKKIINKFILKITVMRTTLVFT